MKKREKPKTEQILFRLDPERAEKVRNWAHDHHIKVQAMVEVALRELMDAGMPVSEGQRRLYAKTKKVAPNETKLVYTLHNVAFQKWIDYLTVLFNSNNDTAMEGIACNIDGFMAKLHVVQDEARRTHANYPEDAPDYARLSKESGEALDELRRFLAAKRKNS